MMLSKYDFNNNDEELARTAIGQQNVQMSAMHVAMLTMGAACDGQIVKPHMIQQVYRTKEKKTAEGSTYSKGEIVQDEKIDTVICYYEPGDIRGYSRRHGRQR